MVTIITTLGAGAHRFDINEASRHMSSVHKPVLAPQCMWYYWPGLNAIEVRFALAQL